MLHFLAVITVLAVFLASLCGWGRPLARALVPPSSPSHGWAFQALLGLTAWALIGGLLNLTYQVSPLVLDVMVLAGLLIGAVDLFFHRPSLKRPNLNRAALLSALPALVIWGSSLYLAANLLPAGVLNYLDDLRKYAARPLQILAEGSLGFNPFDTTGYHSLGLQSFFQGFVMNHFPLGYAGGFDQVLCYLLAGLLVNDLGRRAGAGPWVRTLGLVTMVAVSPQWVNLSSVYSSTLVVVGLAYAGVLLFEALDGGQRRETLSVGLLIGMLMAFLAGLKVSMAPYALVFFGLLYGIALLSGRRRVVLSAASAAGGGMLFILPWLFSYSSNYLSVLENLVRRSLHTLSARASTVGSGSTQVPTVVEVEAGMKTGFWEKLTQLFSGDTLYFGHHFTSYAAVVLSSLLCGIIALLLMRSQKRANHGPLAVAAAASVTAAAFYLMIPFTFGLSYKGVRYLCPILVPLLPICAMAVIGARHPTSKGSQTSQIRRFGSPLVWAITATMVLTTGLFAERLVARTQLIYYLNTAMAMSLGPFNLQYHDFAFDPNKQMRDRRIQGLTRPGSTILARTATPFHLDFARNRVYTIPDADFAADNLGLPMDKGPNELRQAFKSYGINYVIWEYASRATLSDDTLRRWLAEGRDTYRTQKMLQFNRQLRALAMDRLMLFDDGRTMLFTLDAPARKQ